MKNLITLILIMVIFAGIRSDVRFSRIENLIKAQQPKEVEITGEELANFYYYEDLVEMTIKKAAKAKGEPTFFSLEEQRKLLEYIVYSSEEAITTEGHPFLLKARKPRGEENLPGIYLQTHNGERFIHYSRLLDYNGYKRLGEWNIDAPYGYGRF